MKSIKNWALMEPLVDFVDRKSINSDSCPILSLDLETCTKADLDFSASYTLKLTRKDYVHALVAWFDVYFTHSHLPIKLSTSPYSDSTHWKQTVLYLDEIIPIFKGDKIEGSIAVKKGKENQRELQIKLSYNIENECGKFDGVQFYRMV